LKPERILNVALGLLSVLSIILILDTLTFIFSFLPFPLWGDNVLDYHFFLTHGYWEYLSQPANEHIVLTSRLLYTVDYLLAPGGTLTLVVSNVIYLTILACCFGLIFSSTALNRSSRIALITVGVASGYNVNFYFDIGWSYMIQHILSIALVLAAGHLTWKYLDSRMENTGSSRLVADGKLLLQVAVLSLAAIVTLGNGILVPAVILLILVLARARPVLVLGGSVIFILSSAGYLLLRDGSDSVPDIARINFLQTFRYMFAYVGGAYFRIEGWPAADAFDDNIAWAIGLGCVELLILIVGLARIYRHRGRVGEAAVVGSMLLAQVFLTGILAGIARLWLGLDGAVNQKYSVSSYMGLIGALLILSPFFGKMAKSSFKILMILVTCIAAPYIYEAHAREKVLWEEWNARVIEAHLFLKLQIDDSETLSQLNSRLQQLGELRISESLASNLETDPGEINWGDHWPINDLAEIRCQSGLDYMAKIPDSARNSIFPGNGTPFRFSGWAWDSINNKPFTSVIVLDPSGHLVGEAVFTRDHPVATEQVAQARYEKPGWYGAIRLTSSSNITVYALNDNNQYCSLDSRWLDV
jgi:hypothetical protein